MKKRKIIIWKKIIRYMIKIGNEINLNKKDPYNLNININIC